MGELSWKAARWDLIEKEKLGWRDDDRGKESPEVFE